MTHQNVLYLIGESPAAHGIFESYEEPRRKVFCEVQSVGYNEFYRAKENGLEPTFRFILADTREYQGEKICEYEGNRYRIVRTYVDRQRIELTVEEATIDA